MIRTLFFDFGNVVAYFDHSPAVAKLSTYTDMPPEALRKMLYGSLERQFESGQIDTAEYIRTATELGQLRCTKAEFLAPFVEIFSRNADVCDLVPQLAKSYRLVLASNTNETHAAKFRLQFHDVLQHFSHLGVSYEAKARKPDAAFYAYCQSYANAEPHECAFIDDMAVNVEAAERHGFHGIHYRPGDTLTEILREVGICVNS